MRLKKRKKNVTRAFTFWRATAGHSLALKTVPQHLLLHLPPGGWNCYLPLKYHKTSPWKHKRGSFHSPSVTGIPGSAPGSWWPLLCCRCPGGWLMHYESGSASGCAHWPRSGPGWRRPPACPTPPSSSLRSQQKEKKIQRRVPQFRTTLIIRRGFLL